MSKEISPEELANVMDKINNGASVASQAKLLDVSDQTLRNWIKKAEEEEGTEKDSDDADLAAEKAPNTKPAKVEPEKRVRQVDLFHEVRRANGELVMKPKGRAKNSKRHQNAPERE